LLQRGAIANEDDIVPGRQADEPIPAFLQAGLVDTAVVTFSETLDIALRD
jgi:hypothetical protein